MAIASVLMIMVVLLGMAGAFFVSHKADLALMVSSAYREETKNGSLSAAEFIEFKLQNDRTFSAEAFNGTRTEVFPTDGEPAMEVTYKGNGSDPERNSIRGRLLATDTTFDAHILNNLDNPTPASDSFGETPARTARVWITSRRGNLTRNINMIVRRSPFTNASMLAGNDIDVQLAASDNGAWWLTARQPSGNAVRANGAITGPEVLSSTGRAVEFQPPAGMAGKLDPPYGLMQANELNMQLNGVITPLNAGDAELEQAEDNIRGALNPGGGTVKVPELESDELRIPSQNYQLPANDMTFKTVVDAGTGGVVHQLFADGTLVRQYDGLNPDERFYTWTSGTNSVATFDLEARAMYVPPDVELSTNSDFSLRSLRPDGQLDETRQPTLVLGNGLGLGSSISARKIDVEGSVGGKGALKAGDGGLYIRAKSSLSTTPDFGIALHSSEDVVLSKPELANRDGLPVDWDAFKKGHDEARSSTKSKLNDWAGLDEDGQQEATNRFKRVKLAKAGQREEFEDLWQDLTADFPADQLAADTLDEWLRPPVPAEYGPDPNWTPGSGSDDDGSPPMVELSPEVPPGPGVTMENYVRMREYLKSSKSGIPDETWLRRGNNAQRDQREDDVSRLLRNQISNFQLEAGQTSVEVGGVPTLKWNELGDYFSGENPFTRTYNEDMSFRGLVYAGKDFLFDSGGKGLKIEGALVAQGDIRISNATGARFIYNSELLENLFAAEEEDTSVKLARTFWSIY